MDEESQVKGCYNITFICTNQETMSVGKDTGKENIQNIKANVKTKQQQLSNKYSNHVVYLQVTIIHGGNCDKIINNQAHKLCALKTRISQCRGEYTRDGQSIN